MNMPLENIEIYEPHDDAVFTTPSPTTSLRTGLNMISYEDAGEFLLAPFIGITIPLQIKRKGARLDIGYIPIELSFSTYSSGKIKLDFFDFDIGDAYLRRMVSLEVGFGRKILSKKSFYLNGYFMAGINFFALERISDNKEITTTQSSGLKIGLNFGFKIGTGKIYFDTFADLSAMDTSSYGLGCGLIFNL